MLKRPPQVVVEVAVLSAAVADFGGDVLASELPPDADVAVDHDAPDVAFGLVAALEPAPGEEGPLESVLDEVGSSLGRAGQGSAESQQIGQPGADERVERLAFVIPHTLAPA